MRRVLPVLFAILLLGCGGEEADGSSDDGSLFLSFSDEVDFSPRSFSLTSFDTLEGSRDDGLNVYYENGSKTLEIDLPSGATTDLETDTRAFVLYHDVFGEAEGVAGTVRVLSSTDREIGLRLYDVVMLDADGEGEAVLSGTITVKNLVPSASERKATSHPRTPRKRANRA